MEIIISILAGFLFTVGVYNILQKQLLRIAIGTGLISHGAHLFILTMGKLKNGQPPIIQEGITEYTDRSEEHTSELQSRGHLVCRLLLEKKLKQRACTVAGETTWRCLRRAQSGRTPTKKGATSGCHTQLATSTRGLPAAITIARSVS